MISKRLFNMEFITESEDSDGEGGLGNVSRIIIRPPGVSGKAKRGHLCFDAAFETGNLGKAELVGEFEYDLYLRPDTCNPRFRFWFNFTVDNVKQDQRVLFNVVNFSKCHNLFNNGLVPLVKSSSRPKWQRLSRKHIFYYKSPHHRNHYVLSFAFSFDKEDEVYQFALAPPYSYSRLQSYLLFIENRQDNNDKKFTRTQIAKSLQNRTIDLITINQIVNNREEHNRVERNFIRVIVLLSRISAGSSPASYVCQGFLEFLLSNHNIAKILREHFVFKIVPMVNPDGVFLGNNRCNLIGQDLNRIWHVANEFLHPEIYAIKNMLKDIDNSDIYQIDFVIDLHANNSSHGCFIYGNTYEDVYRYERHLVFPRLFNANTPECSSNNMLFNTDEKKIGSTRRYCCDRLSDTVNAYTLEISIGGHYLKDGKSLTLYTEESYYRCGRNLARTFLHYYRFINILPVPLTTKVKSKSKRRPRTHRAQSRSVTRYEVKTRPKTTRCYAPISYTNLSITCNDSDGSSDDGLGLLHHSRNRSLAPGSSHFSGYRNYRKVATSSLMSGYLPQDQLTLLRIKSGKYMNFNYEYSDTVMDHRRPLTTQSELDTKQTQLTVTFNAPSKPYLSIIDLNQMTRGSLSNKTSSLEY